MGTATFEAKLAQQLEGISREPLLQVFLDMRKAYDFLDGGQCMEIIRGYGMGQNTVYLISHHWDNLLSVTKAIRFLGMDFGTGRGVTQGYPVPPMIFNIVMDAVVRAVLEVFCGTQ